MLRKNDVFAQRSKIQPSTANLAARFTHSVMQRYVIGWDHGRKQKCVMEHLRQPPRPVCRSTLTAPSQLVRTTAQLVLKVGEDTAKMAYFAQHEKQYLGNCGSAVAVNYRRGTGFCVPARQCSPSPSCCLLFSQLLLTLTRKKPPTHHSFSLNMSAYQANGKPLSQQALYQQKLRLGVYNSPGLPSVGVSSSASDSAALLAASADLTVKPSYERLRAAPDAQTAALAARTDSIASWQRKLTDPDADAAAANARYTEPSPNSEARPDLGLPASYNKGNVYKRASSNSTYSMTSRTTPEKLTSRHGLASVPRSTPSGSLNIGKISQLADKNSSKTLNARFNPEVDHRHGVKSPPTEYLNEAEESEAANSAAAALTMKHGGGYTNSVSSQKRTKGFAAVDVVDATLLAAASKKASERLNSLQAIGQTDLRAQAQLYSKALVAAHKNSEERIKNNKAGLIDLGGGLQLPYSEIDKMAALIVGPVLSDIDKKASTQREHDASAAEKRAEARAAHKNFKLEEAARKQREKELQQKEHQERITSNEKRKREEDDLYTEHQKKRHEEVEVKTQELKDLEEKYASEKEELLQEKQQNQDEIDEEETGLKNERKEELELMQAERDEEIQPLLDELEEENSKLKEVTDEKDQLTSDIEAAEKEKEEYETQIAEIEAKLEEIEKDHEHYTTELADATTKRETADKEVEDLTNTHESDLKHHKEAHDDLDKRISDLEKEKEQKTISRDEHKREILKQIDERVKDEHNINNELPEHLRLEVKEDKFRDVGSLFDYEPVEKKSPADLAKRKASEKTTKAAEEDAQVTADAAKKETTTPAKGPSKAVKKEGTDLKKTASVDSKTGAPKRKGLRSRFSSFASSFRGDSKQEVPTAKSTAEKKETKSAAEKHERSSDVSNYEDDLSIKDSHKKGGVFKEEI